MKDSLKKVSRCLCALAVVCCAVVAASGRDRDTRVISARAGGVNFVAGDVTVKRAGQTGWQRLTTDDNLKSGDTVRTGADGRAEVLLNPGSYFRLGENSEFEMTDTSLDNLRLRLAHGAAVVEATGYSDFDLSINVATPQTQTTILRSGLYRFNVLPSGATEVFVHKGRALVGTTVVKGERVARVGAAGGVEVAKFDKKQQRDALDLWSRERARELARINEQLRLRSVNTLVASMRFDDQFFGPFSYRHTGFWLFSPYSRCYTFLPLFPDWPSPYGFSYYYGIGFPLDIACDCIHPRVRRRWQYVYDNSTNNNDWWANNNNNTTTPPPAPKVESNTTWKSSPPSDAPRTTTDRSITSERPVKGDKP